MNIYLICVICLSCLILLSRGEEGSKLEQPESRAYGSLTARG